MNQGEVLMTGTPEAVLPTAGCRRSTPAPVSPRSNTAAATRPAKGAPYILRFEGVNTFYGKSHILNDATLDCARAKIVALLGRNGAGKSTLLKTLAGLVPLASGTIEYEGRDIAGLPAPDIARAGIGYVPQGRGLFAGMTVRENLALGRLARKTDGSHRWWAWSEEHIFEYFPRLKERINVPPTISPAANSRWWRSRVRCPATSSSCCWTSRSRGLAPTVILDLFRVFDLLRRHTSIVIVEHNLDLVLALADRVFALERGRGISSGPARRC